MTLNTTEVKRHFLSNFHNICSYNTCLSYLSGIQIDAIDLLIISVLRQQRKYSSERKNKGNNKERVFRSINSQYNMCYVHRLWAKIHIILGSLFKRLMEIFLDNIQLLKFLSKVKLLQLYKYYESIYVTHIFFSYTDFQTTRGLWVPSALESDQQHFTQGCEFKFKELFTKGSTTE